MKSLPESAYESELLGQVCPMVGTALRNSTEGRAFAGKLLLLLYLHGGTWYPQRISLQRWVSFPHRRFFQACLFLLSVVCISRYFLCQEK